MDYDSLELYLQNIEEYVMDEDKIVTYKWLSKNLDIHVNTAKQLLYTFATKQKNKVHMTYLVGGVLRDGSGCKIQIVSEEDLINAKAEFKTLTSEHVYSIQKASGLPDLGILFAVDKHNRDELDICKRLSAITCSNSVLRPQEEIDSLRLKARSATSAVDSKLWPAGPSANKKTAEAPNNKETATADAGKVDHGTKKALKKDGIAAMFAAQTSKIKQHDDMDKKTATADAGKVDHGTKKALKKDGIAAMFAAQTSKIKQYDDMDKKPKAAQKSAAESKANSGISKFFSHEPEKSVKPKISVAKDSQNGGHTPHGVHGKLVDKNCASENHQEKQEIPNKKRESSNNVKNNSTKHTGKRVGSGKCPKMSSSEEAVPAKKLKRIVVFSDSESSSDDVMFDRDDGDVPDSPPPPVIAPEHHDSDDDVIPLTPETELKKGRKRVRRMKDKTFMGDDGYLLTHKEYVIESCTDSEEEQNNKNENKLLKKNDEPIKTEESKTVKALSKEPQTKKKAVPQKTKQATIINFFKKSC